MLLSFVYRQILSGHDKGILSLSWCAQDSDLLLSCGKDNRTICWNPQSCEIVGELPSSDNWSFQTAWCPRNPDLIATASFDGKIGIHSLQNTHDTGSTNKNDVTKSSSNPDDIFGSQPGEESSSATVLSLKQTPKWLRPPVSVSFGFGGQLASVNGGVVSLQSVVTEQDVIERAKTLASAIGSQEELGSFCEDMAKKEGGDASAVAGWKALKSLFTTNSRDELVTLLGFSKGEIAQQVSEAIKKFKLTIKSEGEDEDRSQTPTKEVAEPVDLTRKAEDGARTPKAESTSSEVGATQKSGSETGTTEPSLFDEDNRAGTPQVDGGAGANFFSSIGQLRNALPDHMQVPHQAYAKDSSVAATIGSRASSVASETMKSNTFRIYPSNESEVDRLITRALVVGDFESAVTLCLSVDRFADALVLAVRGGPDLLAKTQQAYFEKRTTALPYLRLFQSIVSEDLSDVVQNADLTEWQEVFVVLCTFARVDEFNGLTEQLGQRIEFQSRMVNGSNEQANSDRAKELRKNALLCYLAAGRLEKAVNIWVEEMREDEDAAVASAHASATAKASRYTAHAQALQTFMEKVAVFRSATNYVDRDLAQPAQAVSAAESGARTYSLAALYDRYYEYADLLATQGQTHLAVKYVQQTPAGYKGSKGEEAGPTSVRARFMVGAGVGEQKPAQASTSAFVQTPAQKPQTPAYAIQQPFVPVPEVQQQPSLATPSTYSPYVPAQPSQPAQNGPSTSSNPYAPSNPYGTSSTPYGPGPSTYTPATNNYGGQYGGQQARAAPAPVGPPPMARPKQSDSPGPIPAAQRRDIPGWNDAPSSLPKRTGSAAPGKPQAIMSPFPENMSPVAAMQSPMAYQPQQNQQPPQFAPPPQRGQGGAIPPPPRGAQPPRPASAQPPPPPPAASQAQYGQNKPMSPPMRAGPPPGAIAGPPPARAMSPLVPPQQRVMSPPAPQQQQYMQPPAPQPQTSASGPYQAPPGARAGPPPPGRAPPQTGTAPASRPASAAPPAKAAPKYRESVPRCNDSLIAEVKRFDSAAGDRSHIPAGSQTVFQAFSDELSRLTQVVPVSALQSFSSAASKLNSHHSASTTKACRRHSTKIERAVR